MSIIALVIICAFHLINAQQLSSTSGDVNITVGNGNQTDPTSCRRLRQFCDTESRVGWSLIIITFTVPWICILIYMKYRGRKHKRFLNGISPPLDAVTISANRSHPYHPIAGTWSGTFTGTTITGCTSNPINIHHTMHLKFYEYDHDPTNCKWRTRGAGEDDIGEFYVTGKYRMSARRLIWYKKYIKSCAQRMRCWKMFDVVCMGTFTSPHQMSGTWTYGGTDYGTWEFRIQDVPTINTTTKTTAATTSALSQPHPTPSSSPIIGPRFHPDPISTSPSLASTSALTSASVHPPVELIGNIT